MSNYAEKRIHYRRYSDRRLALLFRLYETLYHQEAGAGRDRLLLEAIQENYAADQAAFVTLSANGGSGAEIRARVGEWGPDGFREPLDGTGLSALWELQSGAPGALTLTRVKRPPVFAREAWDDLWNQALPGKKSLLAVKIVPRKATPEALWLVQSHYSREWSSRDRDLAEEIAALMAISRDKAEAS